jgi:hypothetical protein
MEQSERYEQHGTLNRLTMIGPYEVQPKMVMTKKNSEVHAGSPKPNVPKTMQIDFDNLLAAAIASIVTKRQNKRPFTYRRCPLYCWNWVAAT